MIERLASLNSPATAHGSHNAKILRMVQGDRTAGSMPVWSPVKNAQNSIEQSLSEAAAPATNFKDSMGLQTSGNGNELTPESKPFGFGDILDIINPLQHIPVISHLYRSITGDTIRPSSQLVGGTIFGGPVGLASGLVNVIAEHETGRDITGNALRLFTEGKGPEMIRDHSSDIRIAAIDTEISPQIMQASAYTESPKDLLSFASPPSPSPSPSSSSPAQNSLSAPKAIPDLPTSLLAFSMPSYAIDKRINTAVLNSAPVNEARPTTLAPLSPDILTLLQAPQNMLETENKTIYAERRPVWERG
jgi:hypothetical protein